MNAPSPPPEPRRAGLLTGLALISLFCVVFAVSVGSVNLDPVAVWSALGSDDQTLERRLILELRLPRALCAYAVGGMLALAGALMQVLLRNPLGDPYVLGISGGAAFCALLAILAGYSGLWLKGAAFLGAAVAMLLVFSLARGAGAWTPTRLLLTGVVIATGWGALISFVLSVSPAARLPGMFFWLIGDLGDAVDPEVPLIVLGVGLSSAMLMARPLNILSRGEHQAAALGVDVAPLRLGLFLLTSLVTAVSVTVGGSIGFVGLIVPHMFRLLAGSDHRVLLPGSAMLGGSLLVFADTLARTQLAPQQLPVGVLTALLGVPVFLYLLTRRMSGIS